MTIATKNITHRIINCAECGRGFRVVQSARKYCVNCAKVVRRRNKREAMRAARNSKKPVGYGLIPADWLNHDNHLTPAEAEALDGTPCAVCVHLRTCQERVRRHEAVRCEK